jgi:hypothetical protein
VIAWCLLALPVRAQEAEPRAARERFQSGVQAVQRGELARAAQDFEAAYALSPKAVVLFNLGHTYSALGRPVEAVRALRLYRTSEPVLPPERAREVEDLIRSNERSIGMLKLELEPAQAKLKVDAAPATLESGKLEIAAGSHVLVAELEGYAPGVLNVDVVAGLETSARLALVPIAPVLEPPPCARVAPLPLAPPPRGSAPPDRSLSTTTVVAGSGVVLGVVALALGTGFALAAAGLDSTAREQGHCDSQTCDATGSALRDEARRRGNVATGLFIAGGVLVTAGFTLYFVAEP